MGCACGNLVTTLALDHDLRIRLYVFLCAFWTCLQHDDFAGRTNARNKWKRKLSWKLCMKQLKYNPARLPTKVNKKHSNRFFFTQPQCDHFTGHLRLFTNCTHQRKRCILRGRPSRVFRKSPCVHSSSVFFHTRRQPASHTAAQTPHDSCPFP